MSIQYLIHVLSEHGLTVTHENGINYVVDTIHVSIGGVFKKCTEKTIIDRWNHNDLNNYLGY